MRSGFLARPIGGALAAVLLDLRRARSRLAEVGDRRGHDERVGACEVRAERVGEHGSHLLGGLDVSPLDARRRRERDGAGDEDDSRAPRGGPRGHGEAHLPARTIPEKAHRIDRLERRPRRDDDALIGEIARARAEQCFDRRGDRRRLRHPPHPDVARRHQHHDRPDQPHARAARELRDVLLRRRMAPHARMHRRRYEHRTPRASAVAVTRSSARPCASRARMSAVAGTIARRRLGRRSRRASRPDSSDPTCRSPPLAGDPREGHRTDEARRRGCHQRENRCPRFTSRRATSTAL